MSELLIRNRQRVRAVNVPLLRRLTRAVLAAQPALKEYELGIHLVGAKEMAEVNWNFLRHAGSTDIITFDHADSKLETRNQQLGSLHGELFICLDEAVKQARRFRTTWPRELARYVIHGILHLRGHDDRTAAKRRAMKREENRLLREMSACFPLSRLARTTKVAP
ncbi:MAG: rRNA maturation RNase YbeY [Verrucomicrobia bacterium]|nr:rRNA maturation RNase YbeY [Verrucomicrobiota bacterium]